MSSYRDLKVWQLAMDLAVATYEHTRVFPREELYGLVQQIRRAAVSVPSNIAEGDGRRTARQRSQFLEIAAGSLFEFETQLELSMRLGFGNATKHEELRLMTIRAGKGLAGLMRYVAEDTQKRP